jgi:hypothetical protein
MSACTQIEPEVVQLGELAAQARLKHSHQTARVDARCRKRIHPARRGLPMSADTGGSDEDERRKRQARIARLLQLLAIVAIIVAVLSLLSAPRFLERPNVPHQGPPANPPTPSPP